MQLKEWLLRAALFQGPCFRAIPPFKDMPTAKLGAVFTEQPLKMLGKNRGRKVSTLVIKKKNKNFSVMGGDHLQCSWWVFFMGKAVQEEVNFKSGLWVI